jgi:GT2 family glycosyltransferase
MKYGFLFVNYNNTHYSKQLLESLDTGANGGQPPVVIVDNCSSEESLSELKVLESQYEALNVIYHDQNVGYFKGLNIGLRYVKNAFPEVLYWIVGNNDLLFSADFQSKLADVKPILDSKPVVSPDIRTLDGLPQNPAVLRSISKFREFVYDVNYSSYYLSKLIYWIADITRTFTDRVDEASSCGLAQEIYQGYGACYILGPKFFEIFDELWAPSFLGYEEFFLAQQLAEKGFKTYYEPSIKITHQCKGATGMQTSRFMWERFREGHRIYRKYVKVFSFD